MNGITGPGGAATAPTLAQRRQHWGLALDPHCIYELDSSTPVKFSRHLHIRIPGHAFATNQHMGALVQQAVAAAGEALTVVRSEDEGGHREYGPFVDAAGGGGVGGAGVWVLGAGLEWGRNQQCLSCRAGECRAAV